jgi:alkanesulfonate monooxygenase SsuD/methylene tetrahydromethanopterin reductase-like flavin-dependent oxidoreductase (luciferase family)
MRFGVGLPAAVPGAPPTAVSEWAVESERLGFDSVGVLDRLVYDNLDPIVALSAAAVTTENVELITTILGVPYRVNGVVLGKQLASLSRISQGRLTAGLALGGWPEDHAASPTPSGPLGVRFEEMLKTMGRVWNGEIEGASGPIPAWPAGRPKTLYGGMSRQAFARIGDDGDGWVAPFFGEQLLTEGIAEVHRVWRDAGRRGRPRVVVERYFCLGSGASEAADEYLDHYYGPAFFEAARADTITTAEQLAIDSARLADMGCDDLILFPCTSDVGQVEMLAEAIARVD